MAFKSDKQRRAAFANMGNRTYQAINRDNSVRATNTLSNTPENRKEWSQNPRRIDIDGIDTPMKRIDTPASPEVEKEYRYAMYNRPSWGGMHFSVPHELDFDLDHPDIAENRKYRNRDAHDVIVTKKPLTPDEIKNFELVDLQADNTVRKNKAELIEYIAKQEGVSDSFKNALVSTVNTGSKIKTKSDVDSFVDKLGDKKKSKSFDIGDTVVLSSGATGRITKIADGNITIQQMVRVGDNLVPEDIKISLKDHKMVQRKSDSNKWDLKLDYGEPEIKLKTEKTFKSEPKYNVGDKVKIKFEGRIIEGEMGYNKPFVKGQKPKMGVKIGEALWVPTEYIIESRDKQATENDDAAFRNFVEKYRTGYENQEGGRVIYKGTDFTKKSAEIEKKKLGDEWGITTSPYDKGRFIVFHQQKSMSPDEYYNAYGDELRIVYEQHKK